ncbi:MAG TPA: CpsB/CapC family capsule biosynthesis tyrosine phosphatase [Chitinophagaceae bacterium]
MFKLFSKSKKEVASKSDFSVLKTDMHSHLIPGIDDGSPDMATSLKLISGMSELGFSKLITTPHIMWDMYKNSREIILEKLEVLRGEVAKNNIPVEINAAAEYFLDDHVEELLKDGKPLLTISGNKVLVEFSLAHMPFSLKDILFEMQMQGYQPVIAHPERYIYMEGNKAFYDELKSIGCLFQLNLLSLGNYYGRSVHELAQHLIKKSYYDIVGTDLHHFRHLDALHGPGLQAQLQKLLDSGKLINDKL